MNNIEDIIKAVAKNDIEIPAKIEHRIKYTLENKNIKKRNIIKKIITIIISIICTMFGSLSVYAAFGGTIDGKPVIEWFGINFSSNYDEYKEEVKEEQISYNETTIDLISTVTDDGMTIFEFDVKLSDEDRDYLRLGQNVITEEDWEEIRQGYENGSRTNAKSQGIPFEETADYKIFTKNKDLINTLKIDFETQGENNKIYNIFIDNIGYYTKNIQTANKISENEYKVYEMYLLTDEILNGKKEFNVTLKDITLKNAGDIKKEEKQNVYLVNTPRNERSIDVDGEISTEVSKEKISNSSKVIDNITQEIKYKKMTEKIDKVVITPLQTVVKISKTFNNIDMNDLQNTRDEDYVGIIGYKVIDENNNEIPSVNFETKRLVTYSDGRQEEWATGDIKYSNLNNGKMELTEYLIIEHRENISNFKIISQAEEISLNNAEYIHEWKDIGNYNISVKE